MGQQVRTIPALLDPSLSLDEAKKIHAEYIVGKTQTEIVRVNELKEDEKSIIDEKE